MANQSKQKGIYVALVFGNLEKSVADASFSIDPQGKRDFFLTAPKVTRMLSEDGKKEFLDQAEQAFEALKSDIENGGMLF